MGKRGRDGGDAASHSAVVLNTDRLDLQRDLSWAKLEAAVGSLALVPAADPGTAAAHVPAGTTVLVTKEMPVTEELVKALPSSVKLVVEAGTGYNNVDAKACRARGIAVCSCPAYSTDGVATTVMTHVLGFSGSVVRQQQLLWEEQQGREAWARGVQGNKLPHFELAGRTLGLVGGRGSIGSRVAQLALPFGIRVLVSSRSPSTKGLPRGVEVVRLDELLERSDFVSVHTPLTPETRRLIDANKLAKMKPTAYLINTARGAVVDEDALCDALERGVIAGAGLDVFEVEPPPATSRLYDLARAGKAVLAPHVGWQRAESRQRLIDAVGANVAAFVAGKPTNVVN